MYVIVNTVEFNKNNAKCFIPKPPWRYSYSSTVDIITEVPKIYKTHKHALEALQRYEKWKRVAGEFVVKKLDSKLLLAAVV